ncbi:hypothetical protein [Anaeroselena agilis]|uniref:Phospholipase C/D domain-containing protein n=1 Tax=Anaeroselena agilis TaxID=3063788 RepID=A0ABU3P120_9FIRM|nr:hypothetical protein [Selenomonadales bacterium 4137-cl]
MFTLHHGFWIYFFSRRHPQVWHFVVGSMLPDYVYVLLMAVLLTRGEFGWRELLRLSPTTFMTYLPQYPWAMHIDLAGHSAVFWGAAFALALLPPFRRAQAFVVGWGTHLLIDGLTHGAHANLFLYPLSLLAAHSPVSYWEPSFFAHEFKLVNGTLMGLAAAYLIYHWWKKRRERN